MLVVAVTGSLSSRCPTRTWPADFGSSRARVRQYAPELGGRKLGAQWRFPPEAIEDLTADPVRSDAAAYVSNLAARTMEPVQLRTTAEAVPSDPRDVVTEQRSDIYAMNSYDPPWHARCSKCTSATTPSPTRTT